MVEVGPDSIKNRLRNHTPPSTSFNELEEKPRRRTRKTSTSSEDKTPRKNQRKTKKATETPEAEAKKTPKTTPVSKPVISPIILDSPNAERIDENATSMTDILPPEPVIIKRTLSSSDMMIDEEPETANDNSNEANITPKRKRGRPKLNSNEITTPTRTPFRTPAPQFDTKRVKVGTPTHTSVTTPVIKKAGNSEIIILDNNFHEQNTPSKQTPRTPKLNSSSSNLAQKAISELARSKSTNVIEIDSGSETKEGLENEKNEDENLLKPNSNTTSKKTPTKETPSEEISTENTPSKKTPSKRTPSKKTPIKEATVEEVQTENTPLKKTPSKKTPVKETSSEVTQPENTPSKKTPSKKTPVKEASAEETQPENTPLKKPLLRKLHQKKPLLREHH